MSHSQESQLRELMRRQWVSPLEALEAVGCMRLAARVRDIRDSGDYVLTRWRQLDNGKRVMEYRIS